MQSCLEMAKILHSIVKLGVTRETPVPEVIVYSRHVNLSMSGDARFSAMAALLATLGTDTDALEDAEVSVRSRGKGLAQARNDKLIQVFTDLEGLRAGVQTLVDTTPEHDIALAEAAGMGLRKRASRNKPNLAASMTSTSGTVLLVAKAVRKGACYEWQVSSDGKTWVSVGISTVANITVPNLTPLTTYYFRFRSTFRHTTSDWSQVISFFVQ
jgi:hypothetical protein